MLRAEASGVALGDREFLLSTLLARPRHDLYLDSRPIPIQTARRFLKLAHQVQLGLPPEYAVRQAIFRELRLSVDRRVLIPRSETEGLVELVLSRLRRLPQATGPYRVLDLGTGSGAIALSLAWELGVRVLATDISSAALAVARRNARQLGLQDRVEFRKADLFVGLDCPRESFDCIVSNPPYVRNSILPHLPASVRDYEPHIALRGGADGMTCVGRILSQAARYLRPNGFVALEIDPSIEQSIRDRFPRLTVLKDLSGLSRYVLGEKPQLC
ncbi:MAG: peptide chain release factor N(5)-glutamine methyltransferase [candidate division WOR-3 bacterium]